uniref:DUF148 domain-containing protein n=1 Tax=Caenorhabditis tropicalis TaxID=1561998 RepID=A0A1I7U2Q3_9PELO
MWSIKYFLLIFAIFGWVRGSVDNLDGSGDDTSVEGSGQPPKNISTIMESPKEGSGGPMIPPHPEYGGSGDYLEPEEGSAEGPQTAKPLPPVIDDMVTGTPEESTMPPVDPAEFQTLEPELIDEEPPGPTTPFDIDNLETGVPEGSTKEPYMPKPVTKPKPGQHNGSIDYSEGYSMGTDFTDVPGGSSELPMESIPPVHWTKSTPKDFTISQKIDQSSPGYNQLLHMLEDLNHRRKEEIVETQQTEFYMSRASSLMESIETTFTNQALSNITIAQEYIKGLLDNASVSVRQAYSEIVSLTSQPSFYYIPKRQRYLMVNKIVTDMSDEGQTEILSLNKEAKAYCRNSNVDTPPYALGNLFGNMLGNGAVITK